MMMLITIWVLAVLSLLLVGAAVILGAWLFACGQKGETPKLNLPSPRWRMASKANGKQPVRDENDRLPAV